MILENRRHVDWEELSRRLRELRGKVRNSPDRKTGLMPEVIRRRTGGALSWGESFGAGVLWNADLFSYLA
jgi:hypothetical protein